MTSAPNVVLVMTDQQRWDSLGCTGGVVETPNIDWLASQGTVFDHAYSAAPSCVPARASLMTGMDRGTPGSSAWAAGDTEHVATLAEWRSRLVRILAARDAGLTDGEELVPQTGRDYLVSPHAADRVVELAGRA